MTKRPDNIFLFAVMLAGVYFMMFSFKDPVWLLLLLPVPVLFMLVPSSRIFWVVFLTGAIVLLIKVYPPYVSNSRLNIANGTSVTVSGTVSKVTGAGRNAIVQISQDSLECDGVFTAFSSKITASLPLSDIWTGDRLRVKGKFRHFEAPRNEAERDMRKYAFINGISGELTGAAVVSHKKNNGFFRILKNAGDHVTGIYEKRLSYRASGFMSAIILGRKEGLERTVIKNFSDSGTIHILAVSGLHVGFLISILALINGMFGIRRIPLIIINSAALFGYAALTGAGPSVIRAVLMAVILMLSHPMKRKLRFIDIIGTAGILSIIYDPAQIFNPGFVLSFGAVASIALIHTRLMKLCGKFLRTGRNTADKLIESVILSISVTIGLIPFALFIFGRYNLLSVLSNVFLIPLAGLIFLLGAVLIVADRIEILAEFVSDMTEVLYYLISTVAEVTAKIEVFTVEFRADLITAVSLAGIVVSLFYIESYARRTLLTGALSILMCLNIYLADPSPEVYFFKTSTDDAFIFSGCGVNILSAGKLSGSEISRIIKPYVASRGIGRIDYLVWRGEWHEAEKALSTLDVPVTNLVLADRTYVPYGDFAVYDLKSISSVIKFPEGSIEFLNDNDFIISPGGSDRFYISAGEKEFGESVKMYRGGEVKKSLYKKSSNVF
jgi:ComEC/Rec2-related protein